MIILSTTRLLFFNQVMNGGGTKFMGNEKKIVLVSGELNKQPAFINNLIHERSTTITYYVFIQNSTKNVLFYYLKLQLGYCME